MTDRIDSFRNEYRWLSNFCPCSIEFDGVVYPSVEHAYQAAKTTDPSTRKLFAGLPTPGEAKRLGQTVKLRPHWERDKLAVMELLLDIKFRHPELAAKLRATGDAHLEEGNWWGDTFWGTVQGKGENHLGRLLMALRERLKTQE